MTETWIESEEQRKLADLQGDVSAIIAQYEACLSSLAGERALHDQEVSARSTCERSPPVDPHAAAVPL